MGLISKTTIVHHVFFCIDPRTHNWFLAGSPFPMLGVIVIYLSLVYFIVPKYKLRENGQIQLYRLTHFQVHGKSRTIQDEDFPRLLQSVSSRILHYGGSEGKSSVAGHVGYIFKNFINCSACKPDGRLIIFIGAMKQIIPIIQKL